MCNSYTPRYFLFIHKHLGVLTTLQKLIIPEILEIHVPYGLQELYIY